MSVLVLHLDLHPFITQAFTDTVITTIGIHIMDIMVAIGVDIRITPIFTFTIPTIKIKDIAEMRKSIERAQETPA